MASPGSHLASRPAPPPRSAPARGGEAGPARRLPRLPGRGALPAAGSTCARAPSARALRLLTRRGGAPVPGDGLRLPQVLPGRVSRNRGHSVRPGAPGRESRIARARLGRRHDRNRLPTRGRTPAARTRHGRPPPHGSSGARRGRPAHRSRRRHAPRLRGPPPGRRRRPDLPRGCAGTREALPPALPPLPFRARLRARGTRDPDADRSRGGHRSRGGGAAARQPPLARPPPRHADGAAHADAGAAASGQVPYLFRRSAPPEGPRRPRVRGARRSARADDSPGADRPEPHDAPARLLVNGVFPRRPRARSRVRGGERASKGGFLMRGTCRVLTWFAPRMTAAAVLLLSGCTALSTDVLVN